MLTLHSSVASQVSDHASACKKQSLDTVFALFGDWIDEAPSAIQGTILVQHVFDDTVSVDWTEEDVVFLHWRLLKELAALSKPDRPLDEKIDILLWVFTDQSRDRRPFSFLNCLKVVGCSPLSPLPYLGLLDADTIRDWIRHRLRTWFEATMERYPLWVKNEILQNPGWIAQRLEKNPQWINEEIKKRTVQRDLFV